MGKYMRKEKLSGEVAVMELAHSHLGVLTRTRARSLAAAAAAAATPASPPPSYLQLRSRRLQKPSSSPARPRPDPSSTSKGRSCSSEIRGEAEAEAEADEGVEASFGENLLEVEDRERDARETTPCSLIRDPESIRTPGSTTRPTSSSSANRRMGNSLSRNFPTTHEMDEFFAGVEQLQQKIFIEKYNFDPVNDQPLPGRYEWVKMGS